MATVSDAAANDGEMQFELDRRHELTNGYVRLVGPIGRFPAVVQITSCRNPQSEVFPSLFFRSETQVSSLADLAGTTMWGELFIQTQPGRDLWMSPQDAPVEFTVTSAAPLRLECEFSGATLEHVETGRTVESSGRIVAVVP